MDTNSLPPSTLLVTKYLLLPSPHTQTTLIPLQNETVAASNLGAPGDGE